MNDTKTHELKTIQPYFDAIAALRKLFDVRKNDRGFQVGDILLLREWTGSRYTGFQLRMFVSYILDDFVGLADGYVALGLHTCGDQFRERRVEE